MPEAAVTSEKRKVGAAGGFSVTPAGVFWAAAVPTLTPHTSKTQLSMCRTRIHILLEYTNLMGAIRTGLFLFFIAICCPAQSVSPVLPTPRFEDVSKAAGLTVSHNSTPEKRYILDSMSGGVGCIE